MDTVSQQGFGTGYRQSGAAFVFRNAIRLDGSDPVTGMGRELIPGDRTQKKADTKPEKR